MTSATSRILALFVLLLSVSVCGDDGVGPAPAGPAVTISGAHGLLVGESLTLSASTERGTDTAYDWSSSDGDVASVQEGVVTGVGPGEASITATGVDSGAMGAHVVVVSEEDDDSVVVTVTGNPFVKVGGTVTLMASTTGASDGSYTWGSGDSAIATVDDSGVVTGQAAGQTTIEATGADTGETGSMVVVVQNEIPNYEDWLSSAHADTTAEAFNHWNDEEPPEIPTFCARCHSTPGYRDYLGADGSDPNQVDSAAPVGTVIDCGACHNDAAEKLSDVTFPSGVTVDELGAEARCMVCHQGRSSTDDFDEAITTAGVSGPDEVNQNLDFQNIHYYAAAATLNGGRVRGGYQYSDSVYDWRFRHVPGYNECTGCHNPHSLEVKIEECADCHTNVSNTEDLKDIRMLASLGQDYDGDGDLSEGIYYEIETLKELTLQAVQTYTAEQGLGDICYGGASYPYWFADTNGNGTCESDEAEFGNRWQQWTARLLRATYNYQVASKDPGGFAHNGKYIIQLLYDSVEHVNAALSTPVDISDAERNDFGHFNGASEAARHWDEDEAVKASCSKCHSGSEGFRFYLKHGVGKPVDEPDNGMDCATCHENFGTSFDVVQVDEVTYPSGITISEPGQTSNVCGVCHSGREAKSTIDAAIASNDLGFRNVHYLPASAVKEGTNAKVGYEYDGKSYAGEWVFHGRCVNCHNPVATNHTFSPQDNPACTGGCHAPTPIEQIRTQHLLDYDDDGSATEPLKDEIATFRDLVLAQMQAVAPSPICYDPDAYPYFFNDTNDNGVCDGSLEANFGNQYQDWTPALMKAAHNYQLSLTEPGAWAHNFDYMVQLLYDSIDDLGGDVSTLVRP